MVLFPNATITIYNKFYDRTLERDCYKRTVIENVDWQEKQEGSIQDKGLVVDSSIKIFIDKLDNYISPKSFRRLGPEERENYFTLDIGDLIVKGEVQFEITGQKPFTIKNLEQNYDDVVSILAVSKFSEHFEVECK
ncbi:TPA: hypothetical protein I9Z52_002927 [Clostridium perfringens]|nr:hypothetical protein [Clostridium perfringens]